MLRILCLGLLGMGLLPATVRAEVRTLRAPNNGQVPAVAFDAKGTLHMAYGAGSPGNAFYVQSTDAGKTFSKPVRLNPRPNTTGTGMERGPRLALGKGGVIHIVLQGYYKSGAGVWYTRSTDGGKSFEPERRLEDPEYGLDNLALAADSAGGVFVLWTGGFPGREKDPESEVASPIVLVRSSDNGKTFTKNALLQSDHPASSYACGCCRLEAQVGDDGNLYVAFRGGYKGLRDPWLLVGRKTENNFKCLNVHVDKWATTCPMQGMPLRVDAKGRVLFSWMSRDRAYWTMSEENAKNFRPPVAAPDQGKGKQAFPMALANDRGQVLLVWTQSGEVRWAIYQADGTPTAERGVAGKQAGDNKPTALVGPDGNFWIVW
jgi:hypothetical protein